MSQPRNNLEALQHQIPQQQQKSTYFAATQSPKPSKFKPAKAIPAIVHNGPSQLSSFSSGCGKENYRHPAPAAAVPLAHPSSEAIDISSSDSTSSVSTRSIPSKRASCESGPALPLSPKRQRIAISISEKENQFSVSHKGKAKASPPPSHHSAFYAVAPPSEASTSFTSFQPPRTPRRIATRPFTYKYQVHSDLPDRTAQELQQLYEINDAHFHAVRKNRDLYRMRKALNHDPYILDGLLGLLEDRLRAITEAIAASESDSEDAAFPLESTEDILRAVTPSTRTQAHEISPLIIEHETHFATSTAGCRAVAPKVAPSTRTHTLDLTRDPVISFQIQKDETQLFDEDFIGDDAPISCTISHDSTLVADATDHFAGPDKVVNDDAHTITTSGSHSPHLLASDAADKLDVQKDVQRMLSSDDDELWNHVDDKVRDDSVEAVLPDANKPAPSFPAVATLRPPPAEAPSEASLKSSPHYPEVLDKLRNVFHLKAFRKNQLAAIMSTLDGRDALVLMPTGGGKSLCYQLPAICRGGKTNGVTIVVTPLRALMADQVKRLRAEHINVMMLASLDSHDGNSMQDLRVAASKPCLAYITPEKLCCSDGTKGVLKDLHARRQLARFVIDEAHLINTWGRDFRSEGYAALHNLRTEYPGVPFVALTATATSEALQDIVTTLSLSNYVLLSQSFNRPNLRYKIIPKKRDVEANMIEFIQENYPNQTGIIYCIARAKTEEVAMRLRMQGLDARHFHAKVDPSDKERIQQQWQNDECKIIVATIAFGMGVDKANVRFVIHLDLPDSIDAYVKSPKYESPDQDKLTGTAKRLAAPAETGKSRIAYSVNLSKQLTQILELILSFADYNYNDTQRRMLQINKDDKISEEQKSRKRQALLTVNAFCLNEIDCRRVLILSHFTEAFDPASCNSTCDNCASTGEVEEVDLTDPAILYVELIQELQRARMKITGPLSLHAFRGTSGADMTRRGFNTLSRFGKGSHISADLSKRLFDHLVARQILFTELEESQVPNRAPISYLGPKADEFLKEKQHFLLKIRSTKKGVGAIKFKRVATAAQAPAPTISVRRKRPRVDTADDPVEPFSPRDAEPLFDDIEPELDIPEVSTPPLLEARRRRRVSPSIEVLEESREPGLDENQECYQALCTLRDQFAVERKCDPQDVLVDECLETLSCILPCDGVAFKEVLVMGEELDADAAHDKWVTFGKPFLDVTSKYAMRMRAKSSPTFTPAELHELFDYQGASSTKTVGER